VEMKEKQALEEMNMATIEKMYQRLNDDSGIQAHSWVRVVEE